MEKQRLTIEIDPSLLIQYPTIMDALQAAIKEHVQITKMPEKTLAIDLGMSVSMFSRKQSINPNDRAAFTPQQLLRLMGLLKSDILRDWLYAWHHVNAQQPCGVTPKDIQEIKHEVSKLLKRLDAFTGANDAQD